MADACVIHPAKLSGFKNWTQRVAPPIGQQTRALAVGGPSSLVVAPLRDMGAAPDSPSVCYVSADGGKTFNGIDYIVKANDASITRRVSGRGAYGGGVFGFGDILSFNSISGYQNISVMSMLQVDSVSVIDTITSVLPYAGAQKQGDRRRVNALEVSAGQGRFYVRTMSSATYSLGGCGVRGVIYGEGNSSGVFGVVTSITNNQSLTVLPYDVATNALYYNGAVGVLGVNVAGNGWLYQWALPSLGGVSSAGAATFYDLDGSTDVTATRMAVGTARKMSAVSLSVIGKNQDKLLLITRNCQVGDPHENEFDYWVSTDLMLTWRRICNPPQTAPTSIEWCTPTYGRGRFHEEVLAMIDLGGDFMALLVNNGSGWETDWRISALPTELHATADLSQGFAIEYNEAFDTWIFALADYGILTAEVDYTLRPQTILPLPDPGAP